MHPSATQSLALAFGIGAVISLVCMRLRVPAILPLLLAGFALGRSGLGVVDSADLGAGLGAFISVSIGVLIFEGGLHLDMIALRKAPRAVWGMLTRGAIVSWGSTAVIAHMVLGMAWPTAFLLGAILMVTGPTVVQPILRRVRLTPNLHSMLGTEAVLIDPIGVIAAVAMLDICLASAAGQSPIVGAVAASTAEPIVSMLWRYLRPLTGGVIVGAVIGILARWVMKFIGRQQRVDATQLNLLAIAACMLSVGLGEWTAPEAGLAAATVCAVLMANATIRGARDMRLFKEQISIVLVGSLFILLVSRLDVQQLVLVGPTELLFLGGIVLVVRPLAVIMGAFGSVLTWRERVFAAFMAPRGIVAASVASISAGALMQAGVAPDSDAVGPFARDGQMLEQVIYQVIIVTVIWAGVLAWPMAWLLRVLKGPPNGVLVVGAHALGRQFAKALMEAGVSVRLVDTNPERIATAIEASIPAFQGDATDLRWLEENVQSPDVGWVVAWTGNDDVDKVVARWGAERFGAGHALIWPQRKIPVGDPQLLIIGDGQPLQSILHQVERNERRVATAAGDQPMPSTPLMIISDRRVSPISPANRTQKLRSNSQVVGLA